MISNRTNPEALALAKNFFKSQKRDISDLFERTFEGSTSVPDATILFNNHTGLADKLVFPAQLYTEISFRTIALQNRGHISSDLSQAVLAQAQAGLKNVCPGVEWADVEDAATKASNVLKPANVGNNDNAVSDPAPTPAPATAA